jgi:hypothetical protein
MKIYHYHSVTGEYLGDSIARESPLEPGVYLIPAHATDIKPPEPIEQKLRVFTQGQWVYEDIPVPEPAVPTEPIPSIEDRLAAAEQENQVLKQAVLELQEKLKLQDEGWEPQYDVQKIQAKG